MKFDWDENKSASNKIKHGIGFDQAKEVFQDEYSIVDSGKIVNGESRWIAIGKTLKLFLLAVVFTLRDTTIRIISARQARKDEIKTYLTHALKAKTDDNNTNEN